MSSVEGLRLTTSKRSISISWIVSSLGSWLVWSNFQILILFKRLIFLFVGLLWSSKWENMKLRGVGIRSVLSNIPKDPTSLYESIKSDGVNGMYLMEHSERKSEKWFGLSPKVFVLLSSFAFLGRYIARTFVNHFLKFESRGLLVTGLEQMVIAINMLMRTLKRLSMLILFRLFDKVAEKKYALFKIAENIELFIRYDMHDAISYTMIFVQEMRLVKFTKDKLFNRTMFLLVVGIFFSHLFYSTISKNPSMLHELFGAGIEIIKHFDAGPHLRGLRSLKVEAFFEELIPFLRERFLPAIHTVQESSGDL